MLFETSDDDGPRPPHRLVGMLAVYSAIAAVAAVAMLLAAIEIRLVLKMGEWRIDPPSIICAIFLLMAVLQVIAVRRRNYHLCFLTAIFLLGVALIGLVSAGLCFAVDELRLFGFRVDPQASLLGDTILPFLVALVLFTPGVVMIDVGLQYYTAL